MLLARRFANIAMKNVKIGTHNGAFHCDEVLACAMLKLLPDYKDAEILRTRDQKLLDTCDIVVDVGGVFDPKTHRYDHHQKTFTDSVSSLVEGKKWTTKLSSAGLVYVHFGKRVIEQILDTKDEKLVELIFDKVYANFMEEVDAQDNGIPTHDGDPRYQINTTLGSRVANLRPAWNEAVQDFDAGFNKAMDLVRPEFVDKVKFYADVWWPARSIVAEALENRFKVHESGKVIVFENGSCPFKEHLFDLEEEQGIEGDVLFAVFTDTNGTWRVLAIGVKGQQFESRMALHKEWRALRDDELTAKSGIEGCIFVHAAGFIGGNKTREGALKMAVKTMELNQA